MTFRPYPVMTVLSLASLVLLIMFGDWQWGRYTEKMAAKGVEPDWAIVEGVTIPGADKLVYGYTDGESAWRQVSVLQTERGLLFLPRAIHYSIEAPPITPVTEAETLRLRGLWHPPQKRNAFTTQDDPVEGIYYTLDPQRLMLALPAELMGRSVINLVFEPETIVRTDGAMARQVENPFLYPGDSQRLPPERHFGYAITWWGLAIALVAVYLAFHHQRGRLRFRREKVS